MRPKEIILLILIVAGGILFYHAQTGKIIVDWWDWDEGVYFGREPFLYEESREIPSPLPRVLRIINAHGRVKVRGTQRESIAVTLEKSIYRRNKEQANEVAHKLGMVVERENDRLLVTTNRKDFRDKRFRTSFMIDVPENMEIVIENTYGKVEASKIGDTEIFNANGEVTASDIRGELTIRNSYKDIDVDEVASDCRVESKNSTVTIARVEGGAHVIHRYGRIRLEDISGKVVVEASNSEVNGNRWENGGDIETSYRRVSLQNVGPIRLITHSNRSDIRRAEGPIEVEARYGKLSVSEVKGNLAVTGKNLEITGRSIIGKNIRISTSYRNVDLSVFEGKTEIIHNNGRVFLSPLPLSQPIEVRGRYTDIIFLWPAGGKYPLEARTKGGDIDWEIPGEKTIEEEDRIIVVRAFLREKDQPSLFLSTTYGTIRIRESPL